MEKRNWLIEKRLAAELTRVDMGTQIGMYPQSYARIENGSRTPRPEMAKKIAEILNFDWTRFYE